MAKAPAAGMPPRIRAYCEVAAEKSAETAIIARERGGGGEEKKKRMTAAGGKKAICCVRHLSIASTAYCSFHYSSSQ